MREVIVRSWCDVCLEADEPKNRADYVLPLAIGNDVARDLDLCEQHHKELTDLADLVRRRGVPVAPVDTLPENRETDDGMIPCPECGKALRPGSMVAHLWGIHIRRARPPSPSVCPDCGMTADNASSPTTAIAIHRQRKHGYDPIAEATKLAREVKGGVR